MFSASLSQFDHIFQIHHPEFARAGVSFFIKRIDLPNPISMGNKSFKLKYNLLEAINENKNTILTFGGAYSNHIVATAALCNEKGMHSIGVIRGDEDKKLNPSLSFAKENGMTLHFISRENYRKKENKDFLNSLTKRFGDYYLIPEGGANKLGVKGCSEILNGNDTNFNIISVACGTATTLAGITQSLSNNQKSIGIAVLKAKDFLEQNVLKYIPSELEKKFTIINDYHFGGYAKTSNKLDEFIVQFKTETKIELEPIYTGKLIFGLFELIKRDYFDKGDKILAIHTGGLQYKILT